jgi:hypothetical protein
VTVPADSAFYSIAFVAACRSHGAFFSVTLAWTRTALYEVATVAIDDNAWVAIPCWLDGGANVAETTYTELKGPSTATRR